MKKKQILHREPLKISYPIKLLFLFGIFCVATSARGMKELPFANEELPFCNKNSIPSLKFLTAHKVNTIYKNSYIQHDAHFPDSL